MTFTWTRPPTEAWPEMAEAYVHEIRRAVRMLADRYAPEIEAYMKANAVWIDRTGNARQRLYTEVSDVALDMIDIILSHGVEYGIYLELANQGRFAIIGPTLDIFAPRIWRDVVALLS